MFKLYVVNSSFAFMFSNELIYSLFLNHDLKNFLACVFDSTSVDYCFFTEHTVPMINKHLPVLFTLFRLISAFPQQEI